MRQGGIVARDDPRVRYFAYADLYAFLSTLGTLFRSELSLRVENVALRHQLAIYQGTVKRPSIRPADRILWC